VLLLLLLLLLLLIRRRMLKANRLKQPTTHTEVVSNHLKRCPCDGVERFFERHHVLVILRHRAVQA